ncbi:hypothetical protein [Streptomyces sp. 058-1L]|uniref:hypothetical protein n=1 Tax=Streptomyces sp. 058-1L TaxID=2789266 RepID=UPI00397FF5F7
MCAPKHALYELIWELARDGQPILLTSYLAEVATLANRVVVVADPPQARRGLRRPPTTTEWAAASFMTARTR